ncbi:26521_t:CDS:1, partial [Racocetra persica]
MPKAKDLEKNSIKQTRASFTGTQKHNICKQKLQKPTPKNKDLA